MEIIDEMWDKALQVIPRRGETVIRRDYGDPGAGIKHSYTIYTQEDPYPSDRPRSSVIRVLTPLVYVWEYAPALLTYDNRVIVRSNTPEDDDSDVWGWTQDQEAWDYRTIDSHYRAQKLWALSPDYAKNKEKTDD